MSFKIPFVDLSIGKPNRFHEEVLLAISEIMERGSYVLGQYVAGIEPKISSSTSCKYTICVNSGTDALFLTLKALDVGANDEVIIPANVFCSVANAVVNVGATPVFCDVRYEDMLIDYKKMESLINSRTKAVVPVHLTGMPCDMDEINEIAGKHEIYVIEDAAQAINAEYKGRKAGSLGIVGCFSFHPLKNIHALGDGGAVTTNDKALYRRLLRLRNHGLGEDGMVYEPGFNSRLDEIQAAIISIQLDHLEDITQRKRNIAKQYEEAFTGVIGLNLEPSYKKGVFQLYMIKTEKRDELAAFLEDCGIDTCVHYRTYIPFHPYYRKRSRNHSLPVTERLGDEVLSLPIYENMADTDVAGVIRCVKDFCGANNISPVGENRFKRVKK